MSETATVAGAVIPVGIADMAALAVYPKSRFGW